MINASLLPKAYKEVIEIIKYIPKNDFDKIPKEVIESMYKESDREYNFSIDFNNFMNQKILYETELILATFFRDYWATEEQRKVILAKERYDKKLSTENNAG